MNRLSSTINNRWLYVLLWLMLLFCRTVPARGVSASPDFMQQCNNANAYLLYAYTDVTYEQKFWSSYKRYTSIENKLVVNTKTGVEDYAFVNMSKFVSEHLKSIEIKTLKADGTVVELDSSLIFEHPSNLEKEGQVHYPIPGVEPGDTILASYVYYESLKEHDLHDFVDLYDQVPSLNTEFTVKAPPHLVIHYKTYNGMPDPQVVANDSLVYCLFKMEEIKGLNENQYTCLPCELPYMYYSVDKKENELKTWKEIYNIEFNLITQPILLDYEKASYYRRWKKKVIGDASDSSKYYQLDLLLADIYNTMKVESVRGDEVVKSSGYFLKEKRFDPVSIRRLYRRILEDLDIGYWAVFARSKRSGAIDPYFIRKGEYDDIFFAFENNKGGLSLLYPHEEGFNYLVDEIPTSLYNTEAVIARPFISGKVKGSDKFISSDLQMAKADSVIIDVVRLPGMSANFNYSKQVLYCNVDVDKQSASFTSNFSVSGGLSTDIRSFFSMLSRDQEMSNFYDALFEFEGDDSGFQIDTVTGSELKNERPFVYKIEAEGSLSNNLTFFNDSLVSLTLDNLIKHSRIETESDSIQLNYYLDYSYTDFIMLIIKFPCAIELLSFDQAQQEVKNKFGEYRFTLSVSGNNQLMIQSNYRIIKDMVPKEDYRQLKQLNKLVDEVRNIRLMIKLKKS